MRQYAFSKEDANRIYDVLAEECGATEHHREPCTRHLTGWHRSHEYRFQGSLGFGGKVYHNAGRLYVSYYPEDWTEERAEMRQRANERLKEFKPAAV